MNNNTFVQLLMDIGKKKTKFKSKRIKRNYLLARKRCYERIRIIAKKKERRPNTRHESFTISTNDFYTLCARENKNKNLVDIAHSNSRQWGENARGKTSSLTKTIRERIVRGSRGYFSSGRAPLSPLSPPLPAVTMGGWMDGHQRPYSY